jgi:lipopolysaccharide export system permease protein
MGIVGRHIFRRLVGYAGAVLAAVVGIYLAVDFFERVDNFLDAGQSVARTLAYLAYKTPAILVQILPLSALVAVLVVFGLMTRNRELIALRSSGVSIHALTRPVFVFCAAATFLLVLLSEVVAPAATARSNRIWSSRSGESGAMVSRSRNIWLRDGNRLLFVRYFNPTEGAIHGLTLYGFDSDFRLARRLDARRGVFESERGEGRGTESEETVDRPSSPVWRLEGVLEQIRVPETGEYRVRTLPSVPESLPFEPADLAATVKTSEEMNFAELSAYVREVERGGYDATRYRVDLHAKIAFPLVCFVLGFLGTGMAARTGHREGMAVSVAYGLGVGFLYWVLHSFNLSLGYGGMLPAPVAAWAANFVFACLAVFLLAGAQ